MASQRSHRLLVALIPRLYVLLSRLWLSTCRLSVQGEAHFDHCRAHQPSIACFFHYGILYYFFHLRHFKAAVMVSASRDGDYIAAIAEQLGLKPVRGSSNRRGLKALLDLMRAIKAGFNGGIVADGSQGPARKVQAGVIIAASKTGRPILPMLWATNRYLKFKSWDQTLVPLPFARITLCYGQPMSVPAQLEAEELEAYRQQLEDEMNSLYHQAWQSFGKTGHDSD